MLKVGDITRIEMTRSSSRGSQRHWTTELGNICSSEIAQEILRYVGSSHSFSPRLGHSEPPVNCSTTSKVKELSYIITCHTKDAAYDARATKGGNQQVHDEALYLLITLFEQIIPFQENPSTFDANLLQITD